MKRSSMQGRWWLLAGLLSIAVVAGACQRATEQGPQTAAPAAKPPSVVPAERQAEKQPVAPPSTTKLPAAATKVLEEAEGTRQAEVPRVLEQLKSPLVDQADQLKQLDTKAPIWVDPQKTKVVLMGAVCQRQVPLELFACVEGTKEYESIVAVPVPAYKVHAALITIGADPGHPAQFGEKYVPPAGPIIEITLHWKDEQGKKQTARAQDWVRNIRTRQAMEHPWVFVGSRLVKEADTGQSFYVADASGDLICVSNFPDSVLDLPVESTDSDASLLFEAFTEHIPNRGTPVTLVLTAKKEPGKAAKAK